MIYQSQLAAVRQRHGSHAIFARNRFRIRRDHILEDAYSQMSALSEEDLRGAVMFPFVFLYSLNPIMRRSNEKSLYLYTTKITLYVFMNRFA